MKIKLELTNNESDATSFTFYSEETNDLILEKEFELNEYYVVDVVDTFTNFKIQHNGSNSEFNFTSSSVE